MSLRHAVLGLLVDGPASGYDLLTVFRTSMAHVWPATQSQLYGELAKLAEAGLVQVGEVGPRGRRAYAITAAGRAEVQGWVTAPLRAAPHRSELLLRVFLLGLVPAPEGAAFLHAQAEAAEQRLQGFRDVLAARSWTDDPLAVHGRLALEYGLRLAEMQRDWARWAAATLS